MPIFSVFKGVMSCRGTVLCLFWWGVQESRRAGETQARPSSFIRFRFSVRLVISVREKNKCAHGGGVSLPGFQPDRAQNEEPGSAWPHSLSGETSWKGKVAGIPAHLRAWLRVQGFPEVGRRRAQTCASKSQLRQADERLPPALWLSPGLRRDHYIIRVRL